MARPWLKSGELTEEFGKVDTPARQAICRKPRPEGMSRAAPSGSKPRNKSNFSDDAALALCGATGSKDTDWRAEKQIWQGGRMKTITTVIATVALLSGIAAVQAQVRDQSQAPSQQTINPNQGGTVGRTAPASPGTNPNPGGLSGTPQVNPNLNPAPSGKQDIKPTPNPAR
jgi:hypothetical protein